MRHNLSGGQHVVADLEVVLAWIAFQSRQSIDQRIKTILCAAAAYVVLSMMAMIIESRKKKRAARRLRITYAPMEERDRMRVDYLNTKIWKDDTTCIDMLRLNRACFSKSGETVSCDFNKVLHAVGELRGDLIRPPSLQTPTKIAGNHRWDPYFKDCVGAIDGTHIRASVPKDVQNSFRGRKSYPTQNVMAAVDFDLRFTYVLAVGKAQPMMLSFYEML
ncbi:hypothetical protein U9M48_002190 [Paspalum notatum var. saurae]|uniref:DDE Tnp4 domain-containing protein n=1 Tax=Paspalum notatum var. saurae TaxID=547442 RepID=A0AAQ3PFQ6_PASNO